MSIMTWIKDWQTRSMKGQKANILSSGGIQIDRKQIIFHRYLCNNKEIYDKIFDKIQSILIM